MCSGAPIEPWTQEKIDELCAVLAQYETEPVPLTNVGDALGVEWARAALAAMTQEERATLVR